MIGRSQDNESRHVAAIILNTLQKNMRPVQCGRPAVRDGRGHDITLLHLLNRCRGAKRVRQIRILKSLRQEATALCEGLWVGVDQLDVLYLRTRPNDEAVIDWQDQLLPNRQGRIVYQQVQSVGDGALETILDRDHALVHLARLHGGGHGRERGVRD